MISIIVICHNYGRFLKKCIKSILLNEKKYIKEILIIDDSSKDNTKEVASNLKKKKSTNKIFQKKFWIFKQINKFWNKKI